MYDEKIAGSTKYEHRTVEKKKKPSRYAKEENIGVVLTSQ